LNGFEHQVALEKALEAAKPFNSIEWILLSDISSILFEDMLSIPLNGFLARLKYTPSTYPATIFQFH